MSDPLLYEFRRIISKYKSHEIAVLGCQLAAWGIALGEFETNMVGKSGCQDAVLQSLHVHLGDFRGAIVKTVPKLSDVARVADALLGGLPVETEE